MLFYRAALPLSRKTVTFVAGQTRSSKHGRSSPSCAAARGAQENSPRPSTFCRSARDNQDEKGSLHHHTYPKAGMP